MSGGGDASSSRHLLAACCGPSVVTWDCTAAAASSSSADAATAVHLAATPHGGGGDNGNDGGTVVVGDVCWLGPRNGQVLASCCLGSSSSAATAVDPSGSSSSSTAGDVALIHAPTCKVIEVLRWSSPPPSLEGGRMCRGATSISFGAGGRYASASYTDGTVSVWDLKRRKVARSFRVSDEGGGCARACFDPSSALIAALAGGCGGGALTASSWSGGGGNSTVLKLFRVRQGDLAATLAHPLGADATATGPGRFGGGGGGGGGGDFGGGGGGLGALCFSNLVPNHCAVGTGDGSIVVWDVNNAGCMTTPFSVLRGKHAAAVTDVAFSPVAQPLLASSSADGTAAFHDVRSGRTIQVIRPPPPPPAPSATSTGTSVTCLSLHGDGVTCAFGTSSGRVHSYDLRRFDLRPAEPLSTLDVAEATRTRAEMGTVAVRRIQFRDRGSDGGAGGGGGTRGVPSAKKKVREEETKKTPRAKIGGRDGDGDDGQTAAGAGAGANPPLGGDGDSTEVEATTKRRGPLGKEEDDQGRGGAGGSKEGDDYVGGGRFPASATTPERRGFGPDGSATSTPAANGSHRVEGSPPPPSPSPGRSPRGEGGWRRREEHGRHLPPPAEGDHDTPGRRSADGRSDGGEGEIGRFGTAATRSNEPTPMRAMTASEVGRPVSGADGEGSPSASLRGLAPVHRTLLTSPPPGGSFHGERSPPTKSGGPNAGNSREDTSERRSQLPGDAGRSWHGGVGVETRGPLMDVPAGLSPDHDAGLINSLPHSLRLRHNDVEEMPGQHQGGKSTIRSPVGAPATTIFEGGSPRHRGVAKTMNAPLSGAMGARTGDAAGGGEASRVQQRRETTASPSPPPGASPVDSVTSDSGSHMPTCHTVGNGGSVADDNLKLDKLVLEHMVRDIVDELREDLGQSMRNMHIDMLRQFQSQSDELAELFSRQRDAIAELIRENEELRGENERLRSAY